MNGKITEATTTSITPCPYVGVLWDRFPGPHPSDSPSLRGKGGLGPGPLQMPTSRGVIKNFLDFLTFVLDHIITAINDRSSVLDDRNEFSGYT